MREFGTLGVWVLAINGTIGAGIFGTPGAAERLTGVYSPLMFLLCGLLMAPIVLSFAAVASQFRDTGGPVRYADAAFGPFAAFQVGWAFFITRLSASAANISLLVATLDYFWPAANHGAVRIALLALLCVALTWVNVAGARHAIASIGVLTVLKAGPLLALVIVGLTHVDSTALPIGDTPLPSLRTTGEAVMLLVYAYVGWEAAVIPAGETRDPTRSVPRALLWALAAVTALYVLIQTVCVAVLPDLHGAVGRPLVAVGEAVLGPMGAVLLTIGIVISVGGNVASAMFSTPRIPYALARDGSLPAAFGRVHPVYRTPAFSITVYGIAVFALAATGSFVELAKISVLTRLLIYLIVIAAIPRLKLSGARAVAAAGAIVCIALLTQVGIATFGRTAIYLAIGSLLYWIARRGAGAKGTPPTLVV